MKELYMTPRTYFDSGCDEYSRYPVERKLLDIGYVTWHGHDIMDDIRYILDNYSHVSERDIQRAVWTLLATVDNIPQENAYSLNRGNSLETDVRLLLNDLMRVYRLPAEEPEKAYLAKEGPRRIYFHELSAMNGWRKALKEERQPYQMYSYGHWIMFPGDGEIIRGYNLNQWGGYPSYVYPEPWYGCPTRAKLIILGNETRYDHYISLVANMILQRCPQRAEAVQLTVDDWLNLKPQPFYESEFYGPADELMSKMAPYNSPTYRFWVEQIRRFNELMYLPKDVLFKRVAVLNANPYPSINIGPLAAGLLPSHYFLRQLVRYITNHHPEVRFLMPSAKLRAVWSAILGDVFTDLEAFNRIWVLNDSSMELSNTLPMTEYDEFYNLVNYFEP